MCRPANAQDLIDRISLSSETAHTLCAEHKGIAYVDRYGLIDALWWFYDALPKIQLHMPIYDILTWSTTLIDTYQRQIQNSQDRVKMNDIAHHFEWFNKERYTLLFAHLIWFRVDDINDDISSVYRTIIPLAQLIQAPWIWYDACYALWLKRGYNTVQWCYESIKRDPHKKYHYPLLLTHAIPEDISPLEINFGSNS